MNVFDLLIDSTAQPDTVTSVTEQHSDVSPISGLHQVVAPVSMSDYLDGVAILLVLTGIVGVVAQAARLRLKSRKASQIEMLEKIWKMSPQNVED